MATRPSKIVQIETAVFDDGLRRALIIFALDDRGRVWKRELGDEHWTFIKD